MKKYYKKQINKDLGQQKSLKENEISYMSNGKDMIIYSIAGSMKKTLLNEILLYKCIK